MRQGAVDTSVRGGGVALDTLLVSHQYSENDWSLLHNSLRDDQVILYLFSEVRNLRQ